MEPAWLSVDLVATLHNELIARFGGTAGLRDGGLLESALERPRNAYRYSEPGIYALAASYAYGILRNHPFVDGNKRVALMCIRAFLFQNRYEFEPPEPDEVAMIMAVAAGEASESTLADWIEVWTTRMG